MYDELLERLHKRIALTTAGSPLQDDLKEAADAIEEMSAIRAEQKAQIIAMAAEDKPCWIPVTERLPVGGDDSGAVCENVCLMMDDGTVSCGWMNGITKKVYYLNARDDVIIKAPITRVTHWMPLHEPPKVDGVGCNCNTRTVDKKIRERRAERMGMYIPNMKPEQFYDLCKKHGLEIIAVPVPPHGDLIDRDALISNHTIDQYDWSEVIDVEDIRNAPTVIEAEDGE